MKFIKILIAFLTITMIITPAMGYEIYEQPDDQPAIWWDEDPSYNQLIHHRTLQAYHPMPTGLDDMRAGIDFGYLHSGAKSDTGKDNPQ